MTANRRYTVHSFIDRRSLATRMGLAIARQVPVTIEYTKLDGSRTLRTVEPFDVQVNTQGKLWIRSLDRDSGEIRSWRLDRITAYTVHKGKVHYEKES